MSAQPIDYAALAKQAGAISSTPPRPPVDYTALAKQAGAISSTPAAAQPVAGAGALGVPQLPAHPAVDMKPSVLMGAPIDAISPGASRKILGAKPISDTASNVVSHLKNFVSGP